MFGLLTAALWLFENVMNEIHGGAEECDSHSASLRQLRRAECRNVQSVGEWTLEVGDETQLVQGLF